MIKPKVKQTCQICPHSSKCWATCTNTGKPVSSQNVLMNILICRLQLGIDRDITAKNLTKILRPGIVKLVTHATKMGNTPGLDVDQLLVDMQSTAIEYLLNDYKIGDRGRATPYLFDIHQGFLTKWIKWIVGKNRRFYSHHELYNPLPEHDENEMSDDDVQHEQYATQGDSTSSWDAILQGGDSLRYDPFVSSLESTITQDIMDIIEDGVTLNSNEYRVIKFCLLNGNEINQTRHIDGLHIYLSKLMGVSRPRITRLYKRSKDKLKKRYAQIKDR